MIRCFIVEDDLHAFVQAKMLVEYTEGLELVGASRDPREALETVLSGKIAIDLLILDIQMQGLTGIELAGLVKHKVRWIIFATGHNCYAQESYQVDAVDYLLKPIKPHEFRSAIERVKELMVSVSGPDAVYGIRPYIRVKGSGKLEKIRVYIDELLFIKGVSNYVRIAVSTGKDLLSYMTMKSIEEQLPTNAFLRIHKSYIIHMEKAERVTAGSVFINGKEIPVGENYKEEYLRWINSGR